MKLSIQINEGPYQHQASDSAYQFTKAALDKGHEIFRVFFYHDGVNNATRLAVPPETTTPPATSDPRARPRRSCSSWTNFAGG